MVPAEKKIIIIAGPNGAGKITFASEFLVNEAACSTFVNADLIASGLNPHNPEAEAVRAGRLMLEKLQELVDLGESFAIETTLSGRGYARAIPRWQSRGYRVELNFLSLPTPEMAIERVRNRVTEGGHHVPEDDIRRRFASGLRNLREVYSQIVDGWHLYDSSGSTAILLEEGGRQ